MCNRRRFQFLQRLLPNRHVGAAALRLGGGGDVGRGLAVVVL